LLLISLLAARRLTNDVIDEAIGSADLAKRAEGMCM
jgi:hypothetical protein